MCAPVIAEVGPDQFCDSKELRRFDALVTNTAVVKMREFQQECAQLLCCDRRSYINPEGASQFVKPTYGRATLMGIFHRVSKPSSGNWCVLLRNSGKLKT